VRLEDLAQIRDGLEDTDYFATFDGEPAVMVEVYRVGDQTPIAVSKAVRRYLERLRLQLPPGLAVDVRNDRSETYRQRLDLLMTNGAFGLLLVFLLLGVFLEARLAFWVAMGIPISFLGSLLFLPGAGVSINMMSMFAFIIALGIVVDDAIVVGENIYHYRQAGLPRLAAAVRGTREVAMPVTFSILTNIVAFVPLAFVPGWMGKVYFTIPVVVIIVFLISLVESVFILPAHLAHLREGVPEGLRGWLHRHQQRFSYYFMGFVRERYGPFLDACLKQRYLTAVLGLTLLLLVLGYVKSGRMGMVLFPRVESDFAFAKAQLPYGTAVARTEAVRDRLIQTAREIAAAYPGAKVLEGIYADIGPSHITQVRVYLPPPDERPVATAEFVRRWRERVGELPGLEWLVFQSDSGGPGSGAALTVELTHPRLEVLELAGADLALSLADFAIVRDIDDGFAPGKQQLDFTVRPEGRSLGLSAREVARQVRSAFYGAEALRQQRGRNEIKVMVRLPEADRRAEYTLEEMILRAPNGAEVPLREAVDIRRGRSYTEIKRRDGRRVISVTADVDPPSQADWVAKALEAEALPALAVRYPGLRYSFEGRQAETADSMRSLYLGLALAVLVMYGLLAVPFRSYLQPAIVMVSIPFGIVGAVLGHMLMGYSLSVMSMFGIVALSGVVVNDSLVLIEFANRVRGQGLTAMRAAAVQRFRPVLLTTLTTFGGLAPMIFETSRQARFMIPMAISLGFGVLFATLITLLLVPALFLIVEDLRCLVRAAPRAPAPTSAPSRPLIPPPPGPKAGRRAARRTHSGATNL
jgi:multidrug efflux pump subunit AcrB